MLLLLFGILGKIPRIFSPKIDCPGSKITPFDGCTRDRACPSNRLFFRDCIDRELLWKCLETGKDGGLLDERLQF